MNIILDISKWDGFWVANRPAAKGIKLGWVGFFWFADDTINLAAEWHDRAEAAENKAIETLKDNIRLLELIEEALANADINVLSTGLRSAIKQHAQDAGESKG